MKKAALLQIYLAALLLLGIASCVQLEPETPEGLLHEDQIISLLVEKHLIDAYLQTIDVARDSIAYYTEIQYNMLYDRMLTDAHTFQRSFDFYKEYPSTLDKIYVKVVEELNKTEIKMGSVIDSLSQTRSYE